jgi:hypothetical protein
MPMSPRLLRPVAYGGFTPAKIADLGLWLDASATSSLTFNGDTVSEWRDLSGNGRHFAQATAGSQPNGNSRTQNGKRVIDFDGFDVLSGNAASLNIGRNVAALTLIAVAGSDAGGANRELFNATRFGGTQARFALINAFDTPVRGVFRRTDADSAALLDAAVASTLTQRLFSLVADYANGDAFMFLDGAAAASSTTLTSNGNTSDTNSDAVNVGNLWDGFIAEVCVFRRALTTAERQKVERALAAKWGLAIA